MRSVRLSLVALAILVTKAEAQQIAPRRTCVVEMSQLLRDGVAHADDVRRAIARTGCASGDLLSLRHIPDRKDPDDSVNTFYSKVFCASGETHHVSDAAGTHGLECTYKE